MSNPQQTFPQFEEESEGTFPNLTSVEASSIAGSTNTARTNQKSTLSERQIKFDKAQKCLENAALVSKRIKEHRKATAELLGKPFEDDVCDTSSEVKSTISERTGYSNVTDTSTTLSVQDALNIPGISESLANTLKQKEILMEKIKHYKEMSKKPKAKPILDRSTININRDIKTLNPEADNKLKNLIKEKENAVSIMQVKMKAMETTIMDLQEKIGEKDQIIDSKNKASNLLSENVSKKEKDSLLLLEDTRMQMVKMQENFIAMENDWKQEKEHLLKDIELKNQRIQLLEESNSQYEHENSKIKIEYSQIIKEIDAKTKIITNLEEKLEELSKTQTVDKPIEQSLEEEKGSLEIANMEELSNRIQLLEQLNCQMRQTNKELENKLNPTPQKAPSPSKKSSPLPTRKGGKSTKMSSPWASMNQEKQESPKKNIKNIDDIVHSLNKDILDKECELLQKENLIIQLQDEITKKDILIQELDSKNKITVEAFSQETASADPGTSEEESLGEIKQKLDDALSQIAALNNEIENSNKNMIKVKSNHKAKLKQLQSTIDKFNKMSDSNVEIIKLNEEVHTLSQRVAELEEEKGNLQLHLVDYDSGRYTESDVQKISELEQLAQSRLEAISTLEAQKFDLVQDLHNLQQLNVEMEDKLADLSQLQNEHVCSEIKSAQLEEEIDNLNKSKTELDLVIENLEKQQSILNNQVAQLEADKEEIAHKLETYIQENMELTDKLDKLSAEKVSSAESIEMVESLTAQEKLELEEYNNAVQKKADLERDVVQSNTGIEKLVEESAELNKKIELFTLERQEVMEKMNSLNTHNEELRQVISVLRNDKKTLEQQIEILNNEKQSIELLNEELHKEINELKQQNVERKESIDDSKQTNTEEGVERSHDPLTDDKNTVDKGNKVKTVKQLTKDILKLKNTIKEREAEIADCEMKILSLEENQQKQSELIQINVANEQKIKTLLAENKMIKSDLQQLQDNNVELIEFENIKQQNEELKKQIIVQEENFKFTTLALESRISELSNVVREYELNIKNYLDIIQEKESELQTYIHQVDKLNEVSHKLKSTIELLEEEKAKDQNGEVIKSLNLQIIAYQNNITEYDERLRRSEEEIKQLNSAKVALENKLAAENETIIKDLQAKMEKYVEDLQIAYQETKERDEEIHEIKLQLRKESIENEKLRLEVLDKDKHVETITADLNNLKEQFTTIPSSDDVKNLETKNKELMDKLKKFAVNLKKRSTMYAELDVQHQEVSKKLEQLNYEKEQLLIQLSDLAPTQEKLKYAEDEINRFIAFKSQWEESKCNFDNYKKTSEEKLSIAHNKIEMNEHSIASLNKELSLALENNAKLDSMVVELNKKIAELEVERKEYLNMQLKISSLENDVIGRENHIQQLLKKLEGQDEFINQVHGKDAKLQEQNLYIESLETEIATYKYRISRLEDSISTMEDRRHSLERKADILDGQLQEKQKAYNEYTSQEDELVRRLAALMDHDRILEKQLHEVEMENVQLNEKLQILTEEKIQLQTVLSNMQDNFEIFKEKAQRADELEHELSVCDDKIRNLESQIRKISSELQHTVDKHKRDMEELEVEYNVQIKDSVQDKKILTEKLEKSMDHVNHLEKQLQECSININNLTSNINELSLINDNLRSKMDTSRPGPDYTEQYINEINRLNSVINSRNCDFEEASAKFQSIHSILEQKLSEMNAQVQETENQSELLLTENLALKKKIDELLTTLSQKEDRVKQLTEEKTVTFEMNIPKTEGLVISSTIEPLGASMESAKEVVEPLIVPKQSYLCYNEPSNDELLKSDPFASEEGWGLGDTIIEAESVISDVNSMKIQIDQLQKENNCLKFDIDTNNSKLLKALKKIKEFKATNEMLNKELKLAKQLSQSSLDFAIEDELKQNIQQMEKRLVELETELSKYKKEKESLLKQNDVLGNANDKLTEMKEKLDNEIELWKYKFKQANDKVETFQWSNEPATVKSDTIRELQSAKPSAELIKLEKENDEMTTTIDELMKQNSSLVKEQTRLDDELKALRLQLAETQADSSVPKETKETILKLESENKDYQNSNQQHQQRLKELEEINAYLEINHEQLKENYQNLLSKNEVECKTLQDKCECLKEELEIARQKISQEEEKVSTLMIQVEERQSYLNKLEKEIQDHRNAHSKSTEELGSGLADFKLQVAELTSENELLKSSLKSYEENVMNESEKVKKLNMENDQLLSTVAELRSSVSTAMDQRGFEIAELWKQHLAQREAEFQKIENELRLQITTTENKYEALLDNVQSSNQEETNTLIMVEQMTLLQNKIKEKEEHLVELQQKYAETVSQMDILRSEIEDEKMMIENKLILQQEEYEKQIQELISHKSELELNLKKSKDEAQSELSVKKESFIEQEKNREQLNKSLVELESKITQLTHELRLKDIELNQRTHDYTVSFSQRNEEFENVRKQMLNYEKQIEDMNYEKEAELAVLRLKIHENEEYNRKIQAENDAEKESLTEALNAKIVECTTLNRQLVDLNKSLEEHAQKSSEMQSALESQELEIVTLKDEIDKMQELNILTNEKIKKHVRFSSDTKPGEDFQRDMKDLLDPVPKAELDLALYMLHQRDVRCEELTMELTQLLEERDTLQLRLSDSLRSCEELKMKCIEAGLEVSFSSSQELVSELPSFSEGRDHPIIGTHKSSASRSSSISEGDGEKPKLHAKLTELKTVNHNRDVRFRQDSEQRQMNFRLLHQDVANLPPEAVEQLQHAQYSLSQDPQSTSTVLLNWLRGKSTPKVVHM